MKIVVTGAGGQLAQAIRQEFSAHELVCWTRDELDVCDASAVGDRLDAEKPAVIINSAAYNQVDRAEAEPPAAFAANHNGPRNLARTCDKIGATIVHFSTDYVFGIGSVGPRARTEADLPIPQSVYGRSKLAGESAVMTHVERHFVVRTCGLFGPAAPGGRPRNFVKTMLSIAQSGKPIRVVDDRRCTPTYTRDLARGTRELLESGAYGLYHLTNASSCTWYEFAREIFRQAKVEIAVLPITSAEYGAAARRPSFSVLDCQKSQDAGVTAMRSWKEALKEFLTEERRHA